MYVCMYVYIYMYVNICNFFTTRYILTILRGCLYSYKVVTYSKHILGRLSR